MSEDDAAQAALGEPEPNDIPRRCEALNEYSEQCIYGARHTVAHHRFASEIAAREISEDVL